MDPLTAARRAALLALIPTFQACADAKHSWVRVARDPNYEIFLDSARIFRQPDGYVEVFYRTVHAAPRMHRDRQFDREIVLAVVDCARERFKVRAVDLLHGERRLVSRQRTSDLDLAREPWRAISQADAERLAAEAACHFSRRQARPGGSGG